MEHSDRFSLYAVGGALAAVVAIFLVVHGGDIGRSLASTPLPQPAAAAVVEPAQEVNVSPIQRVEGVVTAANVEPAINDRGSRDQLVRVAATRLSSHPRLATWLVNDGLMRRFVTVVNAVAEGRVPTRELDFVDGWRQFLVREDPAGRLVIAVGTFRRYTPIVEVLESIDAAGAVEIFHRLRPALDDIQLTSRWPESDLEDRLRQAVDHLLATPVSDAPIAVEQRSRWYAFADDDYEHLSEAQKHLLRMGPENARRTQAALGDLRRAFGWPDAGPVDEGAQYALATEPALESPVLFAGLVEPETDPAPESRTTEQETLAIEP